MGHCHKRRHWHLFPDHPLFTDHPQTGARQRCRIIYLPDSPQPANRRRTCHQQHLRLSDGISRPVSEMVHRRTLECGHQYEQRIHGFRGISLYGQLFVEPRTGNVRAGGFSTERRQGYDVFSSIYGQWLPTAIQVRQTREHTADRRRQCDADSSIRQAHSESDVRQNGTRRLFWRSALFLGRIIHRILIGPEYEIPMAFICTAKNPVHAGGDRLHHSYLSLYPLLADYSIE